MKKDYYEILGVRRNASTVEIELAYKGRRTQYHPDKYGTSDADTQQWATQRMQEVNEAYSVLSDANRRSHYDQHEEVKPQAQKEPEEGKAQAPVKPSLQQLLVEQLAPFRGFTRIYFAPNIPIKKLSAALGNYGHDLDPEEILVLVDTTVFGGSKEGLLMTEQEMRVKEIAVPLQAFEWRRMQSIQLHEKTIYIESRKIFDCLMVDAYELTRLFDVVAEFVSLNSQPQRKSTTGNARSEHARETGQAQRPKSNAAQNTQLFNTAKERLVRLSKELEFLEENDDEILNRARAMEHFRYLRECLEDSNFQKEVSEELKLISDLCEKIVHLDSWLNHPTTMNLIINHEDDSWLVSDLRRILKWLIPLVQESQRKKQVDRFFDR